MWREATQTPLMRLGTWMFSKYPVTDHAMEIVPQDILEEAFAHVEKRMLVTKRRASLIWLGRWSRRIQDELSRREATCSG